jgi:hypothetical protein
MYLKQCYNSGVPNICLTHKGPNDLAVEELDIPKTHSNVDNPREMLSQSEENRECDWGIFLCPKLFRQKGWEFFFRLVVTTS